MLPPGVGELQDGAPDRGLAAAGFANQRQRLAGEDREIDAVDGAHVAGHALQHTLADRKPGAQPADFKQRVGAQDRHDRVSRSTRWQQAAWVADTGVRAGSLTGLEHERAAGVEAATRRPMPGPRHGALDLLEPVPARLGLRDRAQ
jgi:hypothetical protein